MKYIVDIKGEIEGDYEIIGKYEERPKGEWITQYTNAPFTHYDCSICGNYMTTKFNFCPHCGAEMKKGGAENDR